jgi:hypothetical protein
MSAPREGGQVSNDKRLLVVADMHATSYYGLMTPRFKATDPMTGEDQIFVANKTQRKLHQYWQRMIKHIGEVDVCIVNGDVCDGPQIKSRGKFVATNDLKAQADCAIELLKMIPAKRFYFTKGTEYHSVEDRPLEEYVAENMPGGVYHNDLIANVGGCRYHVSHFVPGSSSVWMYKATPMARDLLLYAVNNSVDEYGKLDAVIRSHQHQMVYVGFPHSFGVVTPGWQVRSPYCTAKDIITLPHIGYIYFDIHDKKSRFGFETFKYPTRPSPEVFE